MVRPSPTVDNWLADCRTASTRRLYGAAVGRWAYEVRQIAEAGRAEQIDSAWAMQYIQALRRRPGAHGRRLAPATVNAVVSALSSYWIWMQRHGLISDNPWAHQRTRLPNRVGQRILSREEVRALLDATPPGVQRTMVLTLYATGARRAEICRDPEQERATGRPTGLHWGDVFSRKDGSAVLTLTGKRTKTRYVPISKAVAHEIRMLSRRHRPEDYVFCHDRWADAITTKEAWSIVHRAGKQAGIPGDVSPHWLRHSYATHLLAQGVPVNTVQALMGHARLDTTGIYVAINVGQESEVYVAGL